MNANYYPSVISFRLSFEAKKRIKEICKTEGMTYSQFFRSMTNKFLTTKQTQHNDKD
jgi:antitoxin component of RelBE/YafQ-DinJ toxin-antitoxin module